MHSKSTNELIYLKFETYNVSYSIYFQAKFCGDPRKITITLQKWPTLIPPTGADPES